MFQPGISYFRCIFKFKKFSGTFKNFKFLRSSSFFKSFRSTGSAQAYTYSTLWFPELLLPQTYLFLKRPIKINRDALKYYLQKFPYNMMFSYAFF